jgi:hypothetical protein
MGSVTLRQCRRICLVTLIFLVVSGSESLALLPALAQPLCLGNTIWSEEANACVEMDAEEEEPVLTEDPQPTATATNEPTAEDTGSDAEPTAEGTEEADAQDDTGFDKDKVDSATITAYAFDCPASLDIYVTEPDDVRASCAPHLTNIQFELDHDGVISNSSTNTLGYTTYSNVREGQYRLRIVLPEGSGLPVVFCTVRGPSGQTLENYDRFDVSNTASIGLNVNALAVTACDFFLPATAADLSTGDSGLLDPENIPLIRDPIVNVTPGDIYVPDDSPGRVSIVIHECPAGFDAYNASAYDINVTCDYSRDPDRTYEFSLIDGAGALQIQHQIGREPYIEFDTVPPGPISLMESIPPGFGEPVVYCQLSDVNYEATPYTRWPIVSGNSIQQWLGPSEWLGCDWFNVPLASPLDDITIDPPLEVDPNGNTWPPDLAVFASVPVHVYGRNR